MSKPFTSQSGAERPFGSRDAGAGGMSLPAATRIIALGSAALMDGFRLAGIEVMADAGREQLEALMKTLLSGKDKALVLVEDTLSGEPGPWLKRAMSEGGRVVVVQVPSLARAGEYRPDVDRLIGYGVGA